MVKLYDGGAYLVNGTEIVPEAEAAKVEALTGKKAEKSEARKGTMAYGIMEAHNTSGNMESTAESELVKTLKKLYEPVGLEKETVR